MVGAQPVAGARLVLKECGARPGDPRQVLGGFLGEMAGGLVLALAARLDIEPVQAENARLGPALEGLEGGAGAVAIAGKRPSMRGVLKIQRIAAPMRPRTAMIATSAMAATIRLVRIS